MSIKDALSLKNAEIRLPSGETFSVRRPSAADLIEVVDVATKQPNNIGAWLVYRHLLEDGKPVFSSVEEVLGCDGHLVNLISLEIDKLYSEGKA